MPTVADINLTDARDHHGFKRFLMRMETSSGQPADKAILDTGLAVLNADSDPEAEILMVSDFKMDVAEQSRRLCDL